jgi:hypothetical protein
MSHSPGFPYYEYAGYGYAGPNDPPPPEEEPTHDVPNFPAEDTPPGTESAILWFAGPGEHDSPDEGDDDVDDDDLDPQVPHSPPDGNKGRIVFDENGVAG